jgi:hypothetical protein
MQVRLTPVPPMVKGFHLRVRFRRFFIPPTWSSFPRFSCSLNARVFSQAQMAQGLQLEKTMHSSIVRVLESSLKLEPAAM